MKKKLLFAFIIFILSFAFRWQRVHVPFWVDEFSTANQAMLLQEYGWRLFSQSNQYIEGRSLLTTLLVATAFSLFGKSEEVARLPIELIGSFIPVLLFFLSRILLPKKNSIAISVAALSITSYFLITWSRQARGYALQEFFLLIAVISYRLSLNHQIKLKKYFWLATLFVATVLGIFTHPTFLIVPFCIFIHFIFINRKVLSSQLKSKKISFSFLIFTLLIGIALFKVGIFAQVITELIRLSKHGLYNNIWYYHSFLWREYGLVTFLGGIGLVGLVIQNIKKNIYIAGIIGTYLIFICFLFPSIDSRYLLPIFPFLLLGMAISIHLLIEGVIIFSERWKVFKFTAPLFSIFCTFLIILNGHKFDIKPNAFYSVNHDFREIALIDYDQVYSIIKEKGKLSEGKTAVIDTWPDRLEWYLEPNFQPNYVFRWEDAGFMKQTPFSLDSNGDKVLIGRSQTRLVSTKADLQKVMQQYPHGFIWIDDTTLPEEVTMHVKANFKQELFLDHYPLDDNPYSIWPGTLYSWGY